MENKKNKKSKTTKTKVEKTTTKKIDNDEKIKKYQQKKWMMIGMCLVIIILEVLALFNVIDMLWGCGLFLVMCILKKIL